MRDPQRAVSIGYAMLANGLRLNAQWRAIATFAAGEGEWPLAIGAMRAFAATNPAALEPSLALAETLAVAGRNAEARQVLQALNTAMPNTPQVLHFLGVALIESGQADAGVDHLTAALRIMPDSGATWLALVNAVRTTDDDWLERVERVCDRASATDRPALLYARGKLLEDRGEHDRAFTSYASGAQLVATTRAYDGAADRAQAMRTIQGGYDAGAGDVKRDTGLSPIFVTGKPRSGTTLVEQLLTRDPGVGSGGEMNILGLAGRSLPPGADAAATAFRDRYLHLAAARAPGHRRIVDKSLNTSRFVGMIGHAMPDSPVIWLRRDPLDTAWSSFRTYFTTGLAWSFDMVAMARFHALEDALHAFWSDAYGPRLMTVDYTDLIADPLGMTAKLQAHCGLADNPDALNYHGDVQTVRTASVGQVRQPINRKGIGVAAPYLTHLTPFTTAYAAARAELGLPAV